MPKKARKYPSKKKTTTPEGYREYKKLQMREYRARKKENFLTFVAEQKKLMQEHKKKLRKYEKLIHDTHKQLEAGFDRLHSILEKEVEKENELLALNRKVASKAALLKNEEIKRLMEEFCDLNEKTITKRIGIIRNSINNILTIEKKIWEGLESQIPKETEATTRD